MPDGRIGVVHFVLCRLAGAVIQHIPEARHIIVVIEIDGGIDEGACAQQAVPGERYYFVTPLLLVIGVVLVQLQAIVTGIYIQHQLIFLSYQLRVLEMQIIKINAKVGMHHPQ